MHQRAEVAVDTLYHIWVADDDTQFKIAGQGLIGEVSAAHEGNALIGDEQLGVQRGARSIDDGPTVGRPDPECGIRADRVEGCGRLCGSVQGTATRCGGFQHQVNGHVAAGGELEFRDDAPSANAEGGEADDEQRLLAVTYQLGDGRTGKAKRDGVASGPAYHNIGSLSCPAVLDAGSCY